MRRLEKLRAKHAFEAALPPIDDVEHLPERQVSAAGGMAAGGRARGSLKQLLGAPHSALVEVRRSAHACNGPDLRVLSGARQAMIEAWEVQEWAEREEEIRGVQEERLALLAQALQVRCSYCVF